jgi:26S proteasome regulatory subunit N7
MENSNKEELERLDERLAEAEKTEGESEISDALKARANYLTRRGDNVLRLQTALPAYLLTCLSTGPIDRGTKSRTRENSRSRFTDVVLTLTRIGFFFGDHELISAQLREADKYVRSHSAYLFYTSVCPIEAGGDWDQRNRLKVYNGLHLLPIRQFKRGGKLFIDALSTFTATELISYNDFVALTIITNTLTLKRVDLKKKVRRISIVS